MPLTSQKRSCGEGQAFGASTPVGRTAERPGIDFDNEESLIPMQRMFEMIVQTTAELWINHGKLRGAIMKHTRDYDE